MESALKNMLDMELKCPVCLDIFDDPVILPCRHNFCRICINTVWTPICPLGRCPICMRTYRRKPNLLENFHLVSLVNQYQNLKPLKHKHCILCRGQPGDFVEKVCLTCNEPCCRVHIEEHLNNPCPFPGHLMVNTEELDNWTCSEHGEYKMLYCEDEQITVCRTCSRSTCSGHRVCNANEKSAEMKERLYVLERDLNTFNFVITEELKDMKRDLKNMMETLNTLKSQVTYHYERMQNKALQVLNDFKETYEVTHAKHYQEIRMRHSKIRNLLSSTSMCLRQADKLKFLKRGNFHQQLIIHGNVEENYEIFPFRMNPPNLAEVLTMISERESASTGCILGKRTSLENNPGCSTSQNPPTKRNKSSDVPHTPSITITTACGNGPENHESPNTPIASSLELQMSPSLGLLMEYNPESSAKSHHGTTGHQLMANQSHSDASQRILTPPLPPQSKVMNMMTLPTELEVLQRYSLDDASNEPFQENNPGS